MYYELEKLRFFICNIKWCTAHKKYHPLAAFSRHSANKKIYRAACNQKKKVTGDRNIQQILCCKW